MLKKTDVMQFLFLTAFLESVFSIYSQIEKEGFDLLKSTVLFASYFLFIVAMNFFFVLITVIIFRNLSNNHKKIKGRMKHILNFKFKDMSLIVVIILFILMATVTSVLSFVLGGENPVDYFTQNIFFTFFIVLVCVANNSINPECDK